MTPRYRLWVWILPFALCVGAVLYFIRDPGHVEVRVIERTDSFTLLIHNGTPHRAYISGITIGRFWVSGPAPVEPNSDRTWVNHYSSGPVPEDLRVEVYIPLWTKEKAEQAKSRAQAWPKPIGDWLLRKYKPRDPRYLHVVEVPRALKEQP